MSKSLKEAEMQTSSCSKRNRFVLRNFFNGDLSRRESLKKSLLLFSFSLTLLLTLSISIAQMTDSQPDMSLDAANWQTWFVNADAIAATIEAPTDTLREIELQQLIALSRQANDETAASINYWNTATPMYRWLEQLHNTYNNGPPSPNVGRAFMLISTGMYDAVVTTMKARQATGMLASPNINGDMSLVPIEDSSFPSEHAAVATAVAEIMAYINPDAASAYQVMADEAMQSRLLAGANFQSDIDAGIMIGKAVAEQIIAHVKTDGSNAPWIYEKPEDSRFAVEKPVFPVTGNWRPLVLESGSQFRAPPPPAYDSEQLKAELEEVRSFTSERAFPVVQQATYWATFYTAYQLWNDFISTQLFEQRMSDNTALAAHMYATMGVGFYDSIIACFDSKYAYVFARPVHIDPSLKTIVPTPPHPSYPSAHSCGSNTSAHILAHYFPHARDEALSMAQKAGQSRIFGGIHWQSDNQAGLPIGEKVAGVVIEKAMSMIGGTANQSMNSHSMSSEDLARAYIVARQAYNIEKVKPILADNVTITEVGDQYSLEDVASFLSYAEAIGLNWEIVSCETKSEESPNKVHCPFLMHSNVSEALGIDPVAGGAFDFEITDEKITAIILNAPLEYWGPNVFSKLMGFIETNHPQDLAVMFTQRGLLGVSEEGIEMWKSHSAEFVESLKSQ